MSSTRLVRRLRRSEEGATALFVGLMAMTIVAAAGLAIDYGRAQLVQAKLLNAADAAGLAAGARLNSIIAADGTITSADQAKLNAEVEKYLKANFPTGYADAKPKVVSVKTSADYKTLTTTVEATMPTTLMAIWGHKSLTVRALSEVTRKTGGLEVALVLDTTGSMAESGSGGKTKLQNAKDAAYSLLDILYGTDDKVENLYVSVIPFSDTVRTESSNTSWLDGADHAAKDYGPTANGGGWGGCLEAGSADTTDNPPSTTGLISYLWPDGPTDRAGTTVSGKTKRAYYDSDGDLVTQTISGAQSYAADSGTVKIGGTFYIDGSGSTNDFNDPIDTNNWRWIVTSTMCSSTSTQSGYVCKTTKNTDGCSGGKYFCSKDTTTYRSTLNNDYGPNKECALTRMLPLTESKATVKTRVGAMVATGNTHVNLGAVWGWRAVSPRWRGVWGGDTTAKSLPLDYGTTFMKKAVVLMTDGANTVQSNYVDETTGKPFLGYAAYGFLSQNRLGTTDAGAAPGKLDAKLTATCTAMKAKGIIVYTVSFGSVGTGIKTLLQGCASKSEYYWHAPSGTELKLAFQQIGESLSNLRVSR